MGLVCADFLCAALALQLVLSIFNQTAQAESLMKSIFLLKFTTEICAFSAALVIALVIIRSPIPSGFGGAVGCGAAAGGGGGVGITGAAPFPLF